MEPYQYMYLLCTSVNNRVQQLVQSERLRMVFPLQLATPAQYELRRLFHLMNIQTHRNVTQKALFLDAYFNS